MIFEPFTIKNVTFKNRILRSSLGGRTSYYDGTVTPAWKNFEKRFAEGGVAGIISATIGINKRRLSPLQYPGLHEDKFIKPFREGVREVQKLGCRYIVQIGDPGGHTHMSLFSEAADEKSASAGIDLVYGYRNRTQPMSVAEIEEEIQHFAEAARRVREIGCDGLEVTASKGYLIQQFLNPATNRRKDEYGGSVDKRFRLLRDIVIAVRKKIGADFLFGIRLSAKDFNYLPFNFRWPLVFPLRDYWIGNDLAVTLQYGKELEKLGVDYLHIDSGFGFPNPKGNPGAYPVDGFKLFANATRHLSFKANVRAAIFNFLPLFMARAIFGLGWKFQPAANAEFARQFKQAVKIPIIGNGGFQQRDLMDNALRGQMCDLIAIARPLLANPDLLKIFQQGRNAPENPCTFCSRCCTRTAVQPLGCYEPSRFASMEEMEEQILRWSATSDE
jgi:2,4-dienoyl-CoA reductase (NADPH2)